MEKTVVIINEVEQIEKITKDKFDQDKFRIIAINNEVHEKLKKHVIKHEICDELLTEQERDQLYDFTTQQYKWFEKNDLSKNFNYHGLNLFEIMDTGELHQDVLKISIEGSMIKKIIEHNKPKMIICSKQIGNFIKINFQEIQYKTFENTSKQILMYEKVDIKLNVGRKPITISLSKNNYVKLKKYFEKITCNFFNLWYKKSSKQVILLTEFNPSTFKNLISTLSSKKYTVVFLNFRRPASWNLESINILKKSKSKIINTKNFLPNESLDEIINDLRLKLDEIFEEENFYEIFKFNDISFWPIINGNFKKAFFERIPNYIKQILIIENIIKKLDLKCFICLNETGETEKTLLKINKNQVKSSLLLHGFHNFHKETEEIRMRYDLMRLNSLKSDRFFVMGENDFQYYPKLGIEKSKIIVTGNPKYDDFKIGKNNEKNEKIILITPEPITELSGRGTIELSKKYEKTIIKICSIIKNFNNIKIIVKLHPGQNKHNQILMQIFNQIDSRIPIYQLKPIQELINQCDLLINITCEAFDPSTVMLEGLILERPVLEITLDENKDLISNDAIITISHKDNFKKHIQKMLFDNQFLKTNSKDRNHVLKNYLSFQTKASKKILDYIDSWN